MACGWRQLGCEGHVNEGSWDGRGMWVEYLGWEGHVDGGSWDGRSMWMEAVGMGGAGRWKEVGWKVHEKSIHSE